MEDTSTPRGFDDFDLRLGDIMRGERATMGKSLLDVQRELKIKATYIAAIENSDPSAFETPGFIAGYVRSYARYLDLDPEWAFQKFREEGKFETAHGLSAAASGAKPARIDAAKAAGIKKDLFEQPNMPFAPRAESLLSRIEPGALGSVLVLVALIAFIGYGGWAVLKEVQRVQFAPVDQTPGVTANVDPLAPSESFSTATTNDTVLASPGAEALDRLYRPQPLEVPVMTARDGPIATLDPDKLATVIEAAPSGHDRPPSLNTPVSNDAPIDPVTLALAEALGQDPVETPKIQVLAAAPPDVALIAVHPAWVRVRAADGTVIFEKIMDAGERYVLPKTEEPPVLRAGNPSALYFSVAGETYGPASTGPSGIKNVSLAATALKDKYTVADLNANRALAKVVAELKARDAQ